MTSIKKNYFYNLIYQIVSLITPIIVTPYISRVLHEAGLGQYSFCFSIVSYFVLFASMGFAIYSQREISKFRGKIQEQTKIFWEIILARLTFVIVSLALYFILILLPIFDIKYLMLFFALSLDIVSVGFDVTFLFQGNENFRVVCIRNILFKLASVLLIFILVKGENDVLLYTLILSGSTLLNNVSLCFFARKYLCKIKFSTLKPYRHLKFTLKLFIPAIAGTLYSYFDKTILGLFTTDEITGMYEQSEKLIRMGVTVLTSLGAIMLNRNSNSISEGKIKEVIQNVNNSISFVVLIGLPLALGIFMVSDDFCTFYFGPGFEMVPSLLKILSCLIPIIGLSNVFGLQILIPYGEDNKYIICVVAGAVCNLVLSVIFVIFFNLDAYGASLGTIISEAVEMIVMFFFCKDKIAFNDIKCDMAKIAISSILMVIVGSILLLFISNSIIRFISVVLTSILIYGISLLVTKESHIVLLLRRIRK